MRTLTQNLPYESAVNTMNETLPPSQPKKKARWMLVIACLLLLVGGGWLCLILTGVAGSGPYRFVKLGQASSGIIGPITVEVTPELAKDGWAVEYLATSADVNQIAFIRKERHAVKIKVTAGKAGVEKDALFYVIFGLSGEKLGEGKVSLDQSLKAGESGTGEIIDLTIPNGRRIVIDK